MGPYELRDKNAWAEVLANVERQTRMVAALTDAKGSILQTCGERHPLCASIRGDPDSLTSVCSQSNTAMLAVVNKTLTSLLEECDVGLMRMVVPIVREGLLVGQVTACGLAQRDEEVDSFYVSKLLGVSEERADELIAVVPPGESKQIDVVAALIFTELNPEGGTN